MTKKLVSVPGGVVPKQRTKWFEYVEEGAEEEEGNLPYRLRMRTNITYEELEELRTDTEGKTTDRELWSVIAPFIVEWNIAGIDADGNEVEVSPPAVGGGEQFQYVPPQLFGAIYRDILFRSTPPLARKTASASASTPGPSPETS